MEPSKEDRDAKYASFKKITESMDFHLTRSSLKNMKKHSDKIFQKNIVTGRTETHGSVRLRSIRLAQEMTLRKMAAGDVAIICGVNSDDTAIPVVACLSLGVAILPLPATMVHGEFKAMITMGQPKIVFCDLSVAPVIDKVLKELGTNMDIIVFGDSKHKFTPISDLIKNTGTEEDFEVTDFDPWTTIAFIVCSSGTTGLPKGICLSHKNLMFNVLIPQGNVNDWDGPLRTTFMSSALFWLTGVFGYLFSIVTGCTRLYTELPITADITFNVINKFKPQIVMVSPSVVSEILNHSQIDSCDFSTVMLFACIGSVLPYAKLLSLQNRLPNGKVSNTYGMTESTGIVCLPGKLIPNSCGKFVPWVKFKIVDPVTNKELGPNQTGELNMKSDYTMFSGYYRNPEATSQAFDEDMWFRTGDLMYYDEDGNFFFVDRIKEMFKYHNYQIIPCELEQVIRKLPGVHDVCVVGIKQVEDDYHTKAFVQLAPGAKVTAEDIKNIVKENLSEYKKIRDGVVFMEKLPTTHSGKVDRKTINQIKLTLPGV